MDMFLTKVDTSQNAIALNCFMSPTNSDALIFFMKMFNVMSDRRFALSDITSFLLDNPSGLNKLYSVLTTGIIPLSTFL